VNKKRGKIESEYHRHGKRIAGVDEVGRGCVAGPVYGGCVILDYPALRKLKPQKRSLLRDSKQLSKTQREDAIPIIQGVALGMGVGIGEVAEIERLGIQEATFLAMRRAIKRATKSFTVDILLVDGHLALPGYDGEQEAIVKGDDLCFCIACGSILAKVARDHAMSSYGKSFPSYGFERHVGYATKEHLESIKQHGPCPLHRKNFEPVKSLVQKQEVQI
jgi:ribonuclease HII